MFDGILEENTPAPVWEKLDTVSRLLALRDFVVNDIPMNRYDQSNFGFVRTGPAGWVRSDEDRFGQKKCFCAWGHAVRSARFAGLWDYCEKRDVQSVSNGSAAYFGISINMASYLFCTTEGAFDHDGGRRKFLLRLDNVLKSARDGTMFFGKCDEDMPF
jgi:hypothetical protein